MPTIISHAAVPLALGLGLGSHVVSRPLLVVGLLASMLPDLDVLAFRLGIAYSNQLGHRGFSHSLLLAVILGCLAAFLSRQLKAHWLVCFFFVFLSAASHGLLDMLTNGGLGVAYLWPFSDHRFFFSTQVIQVSPLSLHRFLGPAGFNVVKSELLWVWLPACFGLFCLFLARKRTCALTLRSSRPPKAALWVPSALRAPAAAELKR